MSRAVRPFDWSRLPLVPRTFIQAQRGLWPAASGALGGTVVQLFGEELGVGGDIRFAGVRSVSALAPAFPDPACVACIEVTPPGTLAYVDIDLRLAHAVVDYLLGGHGARLESLQALGELERGVLSYFLLAWLDRMQAAWGDPRGLALRLWSVAGAAPGVDAGTLGVSLDFAVTLGSTQGVVRILVPRPLLDSPALANGARPGATASLERIAGVRASAGFVVGEATLRAGELTELGRHDIVVLERVGARYDGRAWQGRAELRVGRARRARFACQLGQDTQALYVTISEMAPLEVFAMNDTDRTAELVLSDVPVTLTVELARVSMNAEELVKLHAGQVIPLGIAPAEPLGLYVGPRLVARGEMVDVEGELGFRVLSLA